MERLMLWWAGTEPDHNRSWRQRLLLISLLAICVAIFALGVPRLRLYSHDVFFCLDGAWRVRNGQRPVLDFYGVLGPVWSLLYAAALALARNDVRALGYGSTMVAVLMSAWAFLLLRRRMEPAPCFVACIALVLLAVSPYPLGENPTLTSLAMAYNRYGYALASLMLLECFLPSSEEDRFRKQFGGGFSSGLACAVMLCLKVSYGMVGLVLAVASVVLRPRERARWLGLITGFAIFVLPILAYLRFDFTAIGREYRFLAEVRGSTLGISSIFDRVCQDRFEIMPVLLLTLLVVLFAARGAGRRITLTVGCLLAAGGGTLLILTNTQTSDRPLMAAVALVLVNEVTCTWMRPQADRRGPDLLSAVTFLSFGLLAVGIPLSMNALGLGYALADKSIQRPPSYHFQAPHLQALEFVEYNGATWARYENGELFVRYTEEGMELVKAHSGANDSVRSLTNTNPFSYGLLRPPSRGGSIDISRVNVSGTSMPPLDFILGDVDLILVPHFPGQDLSNSVKLVLSNYHDALKSRYVLEAESPHWWLLRKRTLQGR